MANKVVMKSEVKIANAGEPLKEAVTVVSATAEAKQQAIKTAFDNIQKQWGSGTLMRLGDKPKERVAVISTGCMSLDNALGIGGVPRGRIIEIYGPEMSGKTTICLQIIAQAQKAGGVCAFIDAEHGLDVPYATSLGVNTDELLLSQPDFGEQGLAVVEELVRTSSVDLIIVDSVAALTPKAEIEGEMGDASMGVQARLMSQAMRKLTGIVHKSNTTIIFTNQLRMKIGVMFGNPETTTGGNALKFYASVRMDVRRKELIKDGNNVIGNAVRIKVVKNKVAPPFRECEVNVIYGKGIDQFADTVNLAVDNGVVVKSGSWYAYKDERIGQGIDAVSAFLKSNPKIYDTIVSTLKAKLFV